MGRPEQQTLDSSSPCQSPALPGHLPTGYLRKHNQSIAPDPATGPPNPGPDARRQQPFQTRNLDTNFGAADVPIDAGATPTTRARAPPARRVLLVLLLALHLATSLALRPPALHEQYRHTCL